LLDFSYVRVLVWPLTPFLALYWSCSVAYPAFRNGGHFHRSCTHWGPPQAFLKLPTPHFPFFEGGFRRKFGNHSAPSVSFFFSPDMTTSRKRAFHKYIFPLCFTRIGCWAVLLFAGPPFDLRLVFFSNKCSRSVPNNLLINWIVSFHFFQVSRGSPFPFPPPVKAGGPILFLGLVPPGVKGQDLPCSVPSPLVFHLWGMDFF